MGPWATWLHELKNSGLFSSEKRLGNLGKDLSSCAGRNRQYREFKSGWQTGFPFRDETFSATDRFRYRVQRIRHTVAGHDSRNPCPNQKCNWLRIAPTSRPNGAGDLCCEHCYKDATGFLRKLQGGRRARPEEADILHVHPALSGALTRVPQDVAGQCRCAVADPILLIGQRS
jgi:hypothetical protein